MDAAPYLRGVPTAAPPIRNYRDLLVWQGAMEAVAGAYALTTALPPEHRRELGAQLRRAAVSVAANIAEGHGREHLGDYLRSPSIANGSLMELETLVLTAQRVGLTEPARAAALLEVTAETGRMLAGLTRSLRRRRPQP